MNAFLFDLCPLSQLLENSLFPEDLPRRTFPFGSVEKDDPSSEPDGRVDVRASTNSKGWLSTYWRCGCSLYPGAAKGLGQVHSAIGEGHELEDGVLNWIG